MRRAGGWAQRVEVIPGCNGAQRPYGAAVATEFRSTRAWVENALPAADIGCVFVPAGSFSGQNLGALGYAALDAPAILAQPVVIAGYPGDKPFAQLWGASRVVSKVSATTVSYRTATMAGQSGAPGYIKRGNPPSRDVCLIHNYGEKGKKNTGTRITRPVFSLLRTWGSL
jgi:V8-like Glu-specific endopeptidase